MPRTLAIVRTSMLAGLSLSILVGLGACVPKQQGMSGPSAPSSSDSAMQVAPTAPQGAATTSAPAAAPAEDTWPRIFAVGSDSVTVYPPSFQTWDAMQLTGTCAFSLAAQGAQAESFGTLSFSASTEVNKLNRIVSLTNIQVTGVSLPSNPAKQNALQSGLESAGAGRALLLSLDRLEAAVPGMKTAPVAPTAPLLNNPPALSIVTKPTVLVPIQGNPVMQPIDGANLQRVINTPMLLAQDSSGAFWLKIADGWMTAPALGGPWTVGSPSGSAATSLAAATKWASTQPSINLLAPSEQDVAGNADKAQTASLAKSAPAIVVSTAPAEVLVIEGTPAWQPLGSSGLQYVSNTSANIFQMQATGAMYVLVSGRWFTGAALAGPWTYTPPAQLPTAFMLIPQDSPKENVLASIPGTAQAQEAAIANAVPHMARVPVDQAMPAVAVIGGKPQWVEIPTTSVKVLANCATTVFDVRGTCYAVVNGVWFRADSLTGTWKVAKSVPSAIYAIPPSSPYYFATYVRVYSATPDYVLVGYTPGYFGAYMQDGVVVYGTGYWYAPYCSSVWVPVPMTYGCCAAMSYNPWGGWAFGFGMGMAVGWAVGASTWHCGPYPCWGPYYGGFGAHGAYAWGPGGWAATTGNVYHQWGDVSTMSRTSAGYNAWTGNQWATHTGAAYNSTTGARAAGQRGYVDNAYTGKWASGARGAGYNPTTGNYASGRAGVAGNSDGAKVAAGAGTVGNTKTGQSASVAGVKTDNGAWGVARGSDGTAVAAGNNVYGYHDGSAYRYNDSSNSWQHAGSDNNWSDVKDSATKSDLDQMQSTRSDGDWRASNSSRWQSGGDGFGDGARDDSGSSNWDHSSFGRSDSSGDAGRWGRSSSFGGFRGGGGGGFRGGFRR